MEKTGNQKILIITYYWPPAGGPGVQRWLKFCNYLPEFNIYPIILTADPDSASYQVKDTSLIEEAKHIETYRTKTFEPFELFKELTGKKSLPVGGLESDNKSIFKKTVNFIRGNFFIPDPRRGWNRTALKKAGELINKYKIKTIITSSPPHSSQLIGLKLKKKFNIRWIADLRDPWTDIYYYNQFLHTSLARTIDKTYERKVLENSDYIITVSNSVKNYFTEKTSKLKADKIRVIPNGYDDRDFSRTFPDFSSDLFFITYTGTITALYGINVAIDALSELKDEFPGLRLRFVGTVDNDIKKIVTEKGIEAITEYISYVPHMKSVELLHEATLLLLCIPDMKKNEGILTGKLFEYLAAEKPVLCIGPVNGDAAKIISECEAGKTFGYKDLTGVVNFLKEIINKRQIRNQKNQNYKKYSRKKLTEELVEIIKNSN
ncbi:MAG: glycosyltransferase family 4 protein [Candidatus Atribacteria bacterium]|nr:glycosyltransferase family 4 protein [Candidatus Atribacteria bacterium]